METILNHEQLPRRARRSRNALKVSLAVGCASLLAACGSGASSSATSGQSKAIAGSHHHSSITITEEDWYGVPGPANIGAQYLIDFFKNYSKKHPGVKIVRKAPPGSGYFSLVLSQASAGNLPDLLMIDNPDVPTLASTGTILPLKKLGSINTSGINPANLKETTYNGSLYCMPMYTNTIAIFYNKKMFAKAGITTPPRTWAQLLADGKKLTTPKVYGFLYQTGGGNGGPGTWQSDPFIWSNGGSRRHIDATPAVQAISFLRELVKDGVSPTAVVNWTQQQTIEEFEAGKAAMVENGLWNIPNMQASYKSLDWGTFQIPTRLASQHAITPFGGETWCVPTTNTAHEKAAFKILQAMAAGTNIVQIAKGIDDVPTRESSWKLSPWNEPVYAAFLAELKNARARTEYYTTDETQVSTIVGSAIESAVIGKESVIAALRGAQAQISKLKVGG